MYNRLTACAFDVYLQLVGACYGKDCPESELDVLGEAGLDVDAVSGVLCVVIRAVDGVSEGTYTNAYIILDQYGDKNVSEILLKRGTLYSLLLIRTLLD